MLITRARRFGRTVAIALGPLVLVAGPARGSAQKTSVSDSTTILKGRTRAWVDASIHFEPSRRFVGQGFLLPYLSERWQVGLASAYTRVPASGSQSPRRQDLQLTGLVNYVVARSVHFVGYVGGYASSAKGWVNVEPSQGSHYSSNVVGAQAGLLYFPVPSAALRSELRYRTARGGEYGASVDALVVLDQYLWGSASERAVEAPSFGVLDVALAANAVLQPERLFSIDLTVAPFLTRWAQVGTVAHYTRWATFSTSVHAVDGFARLYAPLSPRTMPFVGGFVGNSDYSTDQPDGLSSYGGSAGVRHLLNAYVALDLGLELRRHTALRFGAPGFGQVYFRSPDEVALHAMLVTTLRPRRRR